MPVLALAFFLMLRRVRDTLRALVPNLWPVLVLVGGMGWFGVPLDLATVMVASVVEEELLERDFSEPYTASKAVTAAWLGVYHNAEKDWDLYEMAERLVDLDQKFQLWRFHHLKTVERVIGYKPGTGGTGGVSYLAKALELKFFPELWSVRTSM